MTSILKKKILYGIKKSFRCLNIFLFLVIAILVIMACKYKPTYEVTINGEFVGYIENKNNFEERINNEILSHTGNVAFVTINMVPNYKLELVSRSEKTSEDEIIGSIKQNAKITYRFYAVTLNSENKAYLNSLEEAEQLVAEIEEEHKGSKVELNIGINEYYTENISDAKQIEENTDVLIAKETLETSVNEYIDRASKTVNGVYFATTPVSGRITSRFGSMESIRSSAHKGLDIAAPAGTPIYAAAGGVVTNATWSGGYGNLVIISHGNGIQTYYAHCSKLLVSKGQRVESGSKIALVGTTGNSTGNHLHLEIRVNGTPVNPQKYLY